MISGKRGGGEKEKLRLNIRMKKKAEDRPKTGWRQDRANHCNLHQDKEWAVYFHAHRKSSQGTSTKKLNWIYLWASDDNIVRKWCSYANDWCLMAVQCLYWIKATALVISIQSQKHKITASYFPWFIHLAQWFINKLNDSYSLAKYPITPVLSKGLTFASHPTSQYPGSGYHISTKMSPNALIKYDNQLH